MSADRIVFVDRPIIRCGGDGCTASQPLGKRGGPLRQQKGGSDQGDGSELTRWRCRLCGHVTVVVFESIESVRL